MDLVASLAAEFSAWEGGWMLAEADGAGCAGAAVARSGRFCRQWR